MGDKVSPVATTLAHRHPDKTDFTRSIATRERRDRQLLDLMPR
jgi:hypothetical protein